MKFIFKDSVKDIEFLTVVRGITDSEGNRPKKIILSLEEIMINTRDILSSNYCHEYIYGQLVPLCNNIKIKLKHDPVNHEKELNDFITEIFEK